MEGLLTKLTVNLDKNTPFTSSVSTETRVRGGGVEPELALPTWKGSTHKSKGVESNLIQLFLPGKGQITSPGGGDDNALVLTQHGHVIAEHFHFRY